MGQNKQAMIRYRAIDNCLSNRKVKYTGVQIKEKVDEALAAYDLKTKGVSRAQFYADLEFMKSSDGWNVEIKQSRDGRNIYLSYDEAGFSIQNMPLTELELTQLNEALNVLKQFKGMPQFEWMEEVTAKLQQEIKQEQAQPVIAFDANQYLKGIEWLGDCTTQYNTTKCWPYLTRISNHQSLMRSSFIPITSSNTTTDGFALDTTLPVQRRHGQ